MRIGILAQDGCFASTVASMIDIIETAEVVRPLIDPSIAPIAVEVAASRRSVMGTAGMTISAPRTLSELADLDVVVVPALGTITGPDIELALASPAGQRIVQALRTVDPDHVRLAAACTGVFTLAETGLLDGRRATTTWFLAPPFRARFPAVGIDLDNMVVADGPFLTAGAAFAHIDLTLSLLRGVSVELADHVARLLLIDERPSQAASSFTTTSTTTTRSCWRSSVTSANTFTSPWTSRTPHTRSERAVDPWNDAPAKPWD